MIFDMRLPISFGTERLAEKPSAAQGSCPLRRVQTGAVSPVVY